MPRPVQNLVYSFTFPSSYPRHLSRVNVLPRVFLHVPGLLHVSGNTGGQASHSDLEWHMSTLSKWLPECLVCLFSFPVELVSPFLFFSCIIFYSCPNKKRSGLSSPDVVESCGQCSTGQSCALWCLLSSQCETSTRVACTPRYQRDERHPGGHKS